MTGLVLSEGLSTARAVGRKLLVPYLTGGYPGWEDMIRAAAAAGADAVEVGIPFSDPVMDGPVIQEANEVSLAQGTTPESVLESISTLDLGIPIAVMTYVNLVHRFGYERFAARAAESGVSGVILPDLPLEEVEPWATHADDAGLETVMLVAPTSSDERLAAICARSRGFVYAVGLLGITGSRDRLAATAVEIAARTTTRTDLPVLVGVGVSNPGQAVEACSAADGVVIGTTVVREMMENGTPEGIEALIGEFRAALDGVAR